MILIHKIQYLKNLNEQDKYKSNNDKEWNIIVRK